MRLFERHDRERDDNIKMGIGDRGLCEMKFGVQWLS